jgi:ubiquinone/menaquinone biosynthesis C-methylase UbiE
MTKTASEATFQSHAVRGPVNAAFFWLAGGLLDRFLGQPKSRVFTDLPDRVVELGSGVGANLSYLDPGTTLVAVEPNPAMHPRLERAAQRHGITLELHDVPAEQLALPDESADLVLSSLVLCTVADPSQVLAQVRRVLRPGGRFVFVEHVVAPEGSWLRRVQRVARRPWAWFFEGCSCERDLASAVRAAGFADVQIESYRLRSPFLPFNTQVAGVATA